MHSLRDFFSRRACQKAASTAPHSLTPVSIDNSDNGEAGSTVSSSAGPSLFGKPGSTGSTPTKSGGGLCAQATATSSSDRTGLAGGSTGTTSRSSFMALNMSSIGLALNNIGLPAPPPAPRFLRALSRGSSADRVVDAEHANKKNVSTPPLSCCSKEVAEDPFARVCPSPIYTKQHSKSSSTATSTSSTRSHTPSHSVTSVSEYFPRSPTSFAPISPISSTGTSSNSSAGAWSFSSSPVSTAPSSYVPSSAYLSPATSPLSAAAVSEPIQRASFDSDVTIVTESCVSKSNSRSSAAASSPKKQHLAVRHRRRSSSVGRGAGLPMPALGRSGKMDSAGSSLRKRANLSNQVTSESYNRQRAPLPPSFSRAATSPAEMVHPALAAPSMGARPMALVVDTNVCAASLSAAPFSDLLDAPVLAAASHTEPAGSSLRQQADLRARSSSPPPSSAHSSSSIRSTTSSRFIEHLDEHFGTSRSIDIDLSPMPVPSRWSSSSRHLLLSPGFPHPDSGASHVLCPSDASNSRAGPGSSAKSSLTQSGTASASTSRSNTPTLLSRLADAGSSALPHLQNTPAARTPGSTVLPDERFERLAYIRSPGPPPQPLQFGHNALDGGASAERAVTDDYPYFGAGGKAISTRPVVMLRKNQSMPLLSGGARVAPKQTPEPSAGQDMQGMEHNVRMGL